ncbi:uncharacterized protein LOC6559881 [Drosophila grimshawi]|uniref:GH21070 n=1 Tax=Drosophila grimshawi TaxID=7222 RepID=B4J5K4_DROGR|nr:uncharacterized protein LOC6559881 [Drosophila grimshawi]EDW00767.1 GH21070 [Drosophila grimshawi]
MRHSLQFVVWLLLLVALISAANGLPGGPASNRGPFGGPSWNGGPDQSTDNIILHSKGEGKWRY